MFHFNMHCQSAFQIKHGDSHFHQYYENNTITSMLTRSAILFFFLSQSDEFKVMSHCCFSLQFRSKYRLFFERFPGFSAFALWELHVYIFCPFSPSCVCLVNSQVTDSNPLTVIRVIHSPPQLSGLQVLDLALNILLHSKIMQVSSYISLHI